MGVKKAGMIGQGRQGRRIGVVLIAAALLVLAAAPAALGADRVYWANGGNDTISYANLDGSGGGGQLNLTGATPSGPRGVAIDSTTGRIYWANQGNATISYANLDGSGGGGQLNISGAPASKPHGLAVDPAAGKIYWANDDDTIAYANLDGSGGGPLDISGATPAAPYGAAIDPAAGRIYWANLDNNTISYANLDGSGGGGELDISGATPSEPHGVVIDPAGGRIYWANFFPNTGASSISYANLDGSGGGGELNTSEGTDKGAVGLAIDPTAARIYWGNLGDNTIAYANLDGSGGDRLNTSGATSSGSRFLAVLRAPDGIGAPQVTGGAGVGSVLACSQGAWAPDVPASFFYRAPQKLAYQWKRNGADIAGATDSSYTAYVAGNYRCRVTGTNAAGSTSQKSDPHTVSSAPGTKLTEATLDSHKATFRFTAMREATGFQCKLVRPDRPARFKDCRSPKTYEGLKPDGYTFKVRALGPGGTDPTPAKKQFRIR